MNAKALAAVIVGGLAVVLTIASAAGEGWIVLDDGGVHGRAGLFRSCALVSVISRYTGSKTTVCVFLSGSSSNATLITCQAFISIAIAVGIVGCATSVYLMLKGGKKTSIIAGTSYGVAALSCLICGGVFAARSSRVRSSSVHFYAWGFYLCWVSMVLYVVAAVLSFVFRNTYESSAKA